jgi:glycosyltransferase involved in cell wall biosynthesis
MNILLVSCVFNPEPVVSAQITHALATSLSNDNKNVVVLSPRASRPKGFISPSPFTFRFLQSKFREGFQHIIAPSIISPSSNVIGRFIESLSFGLICFFWILFNTRRFDVVYINSWPIFGQLGAVFAAHLCGSKVVVHVMDIYPESFRTKSGGLYGLFERFLLRLDKINLSFATRVIVISRSMKEHLTSTRFLSKGRVEIVYTFQEHSMNTLNSDINRTKGRLTFLYLGNLGPVAGLHRVIEDMANTDIELLIAGSGSQKVRLQELVEHRKFKNVVFMDVPAGQVENIQSLADVFLLPLIPGSGRFSVPSKLSSYMLSSKPVLVLADESVDTARIVLEAKCGWVCPFGDKERIESTVKEIIRTTSSNRQQLGLNGRNYAVKHFSKEQNINKIKDICYSI